jgi:hypothetical protein
MKEIASVAFAEAGSEPINDPSLPIWKKVDKNNDGRSRAPVILFFS